MVRKRRKKNTQIKLIFGRLKKNKAAMIGMIILIALLFIAVFADLLTKYDYYEQDIMNSFSHPSSEHFFGTDEFGRDIFSRVVYGSRISLTVGMICVTISLIIGGALGAISGFYGNKIDNIIMRVMDVLLAIPQFLMAISVVAALGPGLTNLMIAVGLSGIPVYGRIVRASVLSIRREEFIEAAVASGTSDRVIIWKHILPNVMAPVIVQSTLGIAQAIITAAGMSFIGLGIQPPTPEWGAMLSTGRNYIMDNSYMTIFPGLAIVVTILSFNLLGDGLRDALDPKLKN